MNKNIEVRKAQLIDLEKIHNLSKRCLPIYNSFDELFMMLLSDDHLILVSVLNGKAIGYLVGNYNQTGNFHILSFGVHNNYRRNGVGTQIIDKLVDKIQNKCQTITLYVHIENEKGIKFYEKNGFEKEETLKNYYGGSLHAKSQDAYKMKKKIPKTPKTPENAHTKRVLSHNDEIFKFDV